jgi:hypothetical protein
MMRATLSFTLPDDSDEFDAALQGNDAIAALWQIESHCRSIMDHCDPDDDERRLANEVLLMIQDSGVRVSE